MTTAADIIRTYAAQFDGNPLTAATHAQTMDLAMAGSDLLGVDINDSHRGIELTAAQYDMPVDEFVGAITTITHYTQCNVHEAIFQLRRVVRTVQLLEDGR